jgi:hypothetical protein
MLGGKAEIGRAGRDCGGDIRAFPLLDVDVDIGTCAQKGSERLRQVLRKLRRVGEQMHARLHA